MWPASQRAQAGVHCQEPRTLERMASAWRPRMAAGVGSREGPCSPHFGAGAQRRQSPRPRPPHRRSKRSGHGDGPGSHTQGPSCRIPRAATTASRMSCTCRRLNASSDLGQPSRKWRRCPTGMRGTERDDERSAGEVSLSINFQKRESRYRYREIRITLQFQTPRALGIVSACIRHLCAKIFARTSSVRAANVLMPEAAGAIVCRICLDHEDTPSNPLLRPCRCRGSMAYVHRNCLNEWRRQSIHPNSIYQCDTCKFEYRFATAIRPDRFTIARVLAWPISIHLLSVMGLFCLCFAGGFVDKLFDASSHRSIGLTSISKAASISITCSEERPSSGRPSFVCSFSA